MNPDLLPVLIGVFSAFCISAAATPIVRWLARRSGFVAQPRADRWHQKPTALLGGVAIYLAVVIPLLFLLSGQDGKNGLLAAGLTGMFLLGLVDDVVALAPYQKLVGQIAIATLISASGIVFQGLPFSILALPVTVFWLVAITNAFNLLDNMDGLSAGVAGVTAIVMVVMGMLSGNLEFAVAAGLVVGACAGFLLYNFSPASIFMGDSGSMVLGFAIGSLAVLQNGYGAAQNVLLSMVVPIAVLGVPLFDTTLVSIARTISGRRVSQGGRDHTSHRLVALGLSVPRTVLVLYLISAVFGAFAVSTRFMDFLMSVAVLALLLVALVLFGVYLAQVKVYREGEVAERNGIRPITTIGGALMNKMRLAEVLLDLVLIFVAYLASYLLKFEGTLTGPFLVQFGQSLPFIIVAKLSVFVLLGVYGGEWRYVSLPEVLSFGKASTIASVLCVVIVAIVWQFESYSRSVFAIDWLLFTWLVVVSRMSFRLLAHIVQSLSGSRLPGLLVVGNREQGANLVRAVSQGIFGDYVAAGFVDVDGRVKERRFCGVKVLGTATDLEAILGRVQVEGVVVAVSGQEDPQATLAVALCRRLNLPCTEVRPLSSGGDAAVAERAADHGPAPEIVS